MREESANVRIAIYLPNLAGGGVERAYLELAHSMVERGVSVDLVLARRAGPYLAELPEGVRVMERQATRKLAVIVRLAHYLRRERPASLLSGGDVSNAVALLASMLAGRTKHCVIGQRAMLSTAWKVQKPRTWWMWIGLLRVLYRAAGLIICNSEAARSELVEKLGLDGAKCRVVHNPVDVERIRRQAELWPDDPWFSPTSLPVVICVANLLPVKDIPTLIRAFALVRRSHPCNLLILGEGPERRRLEELIRASGLERCVRMPGFVANPFPMIKRARVLVSASLTEGCPNTLQQALACSTPIVATDCPGGTSEVLEGGRWGRLVPVKDSETMAAAIECTLDGDLLPDGRLRAAQFDRGAITSSYLALLTPGPIATIQG